MWNFLLSALLTIVLIFVVRFVNWVWIQPKKMERFFRKQGLKGTSYKFFHGDAKVIAEMYKEVNSKPIGLHDDIAPRILPFIVNAIEKYGKNSFTWVGPIPRLIVSDVELMKEVLNKYQNYPKKLPHKFVRMILGGLSSKKGEPWHKDRMKLNPAFHVDIIKQKIPGMQACAEDMLNQWSSKMSKDGSVVVDVFHSMEAYVGSVITNTLFSSPYDEENKRNFRYIVDLTVMAGVATNPFNLPGYEYFPTPTNRKAMAMGRELQRSFMSMIDQRLSLRKGGNGYGQPHDLLDLFLEELYTDEKIPSKVRKVIIEEALGNFTLFHFGGFDTTSSFLTWTLISLAIHQDWQSRVREEVLQVLGENKEITSDHLRQLRLVTMFCYEVLRLSPPIMEVTRVVEEDTMLGEYHLPKGVQVQLPIGMLHRNTELWGEDALEFKPDRFAEGASKATNGTMAYMPFAWGPRNCIGQNFGLIESKVFVAQLLRTFTLELAPTYVHAPCAAYMIQPQFGAPLLLRKL